MTRGKLVKFIVLSALMTALTASVEAQTGPSNVVLSFENLAVLDESGDGHYEGWAIVAGAPVSTGKFNVNEAGEPVELGGGPVIDEFDAGEDISAASAIKISIEPPGDEDEDPSGLIILSGETRNIEIELHAAVPGLGTLENETAGAYILATPSDNDDSNDDQGIWFLTMPGPMAGFTDLPDIGPNWTYEGWVVDVSGMPVPYTTGTFSMAAGEDSDAAGCNGGGPPFPGQDFVEFQCDPPGVLDLDSGNFAAVLSIEPVPDNGPGPFQLKPLAGMIPTDGVGEPAIPMNNQVLATFPSGMAFLFDTTPAESTSWGLLKTLY